MNEVSSRVVGFEQMCRLCLQEKRILLDIFQTVEENRNLSIYQKIKACAVVNLSKGDGLPTKICIPCLSSLNAAFDFKIQCENADKTLHSIYNVVVYDDVGDKPVHKMVPNIKRPNSEIKEAQSKQYELINLSNIEIIKKQEKNITEEKNNNHSDVEKDNENLFSTINVVNKNKDFSDNINKDDLISFNVEDVSSTNFVEILSFQSNEMKKIHDVPLPVEKVCFQEDSGVISKLKKGVKVNSIEEEKEKKTLGYVKKSPCPFCQKMLTRVNEHIRLLHQNKVYICKKQNCGAEFLTLKNLQSHQLKCYNMEKPYKCLRCLKEFHRKCNYKAHIIRHSNKKDFKCQLCDKSFVDSTGLKRHFLKHHELQQETFISVCCDKKFKTKEGLKQHIQKGICGLQVFQVVETNCEVT